MSSLGIFNKETKTYQKIAGEAEAAVLDAAMSDTSTNPVQNKVIKNYIDTRKSSVGQNLITYPYYSKSSTNNGITWTVNDDGTVTANGTATRESAFNIVSPFDPKDRKMLELNQTYVLSDGTSDKTKTYIQFVRFNASNNTYDYRINSRDGSNTWTASNKNLLYYGIRLIVTNGSTVNNVTFKPMFEIGSIVHEYQPTTLSNHTLKKKIEDIIIDSEVSDTSTNAIQNKAMKAYVDAKKVPTFERNGSIFASGDAAYPNWANGIISSRYGDDENGRTLYYKFPRTGAWTECNFHLNIPAHTVVLCQFYTNDFDINFSEPLFLYNQGDTSLDKWMHCTITGANEKDEIEVTCNVIAIKNI